MFVTLQVTFQYSFETEAPSPSSTTLYVASHDVHACRPTYSISDCTTLGNARQQSLVLKTGGRGRRASGKTALSPVQPTDAAGRGAGALKQ